MHMRNLQTVPGKYVIIKKAQYVCVSDFWAKVNLLIPFFYTCWEVPSYLLLSVQHYTGSCPEAELATTALFKDTQGRSYQHHCPDQREWLPSPWKLGWTELISSSDFSTGRCSIRLFLRDHALDSDGQGLLLVGRLIFHDFSLCTYFSLPIGWVVIKIRLI